MERCFTCKGQVFTSDIKGRTSFRGKPIVICSPCRGRYAYTLEQVAATGLRFRLVRKSEIPQPPVFGDRTQISNVQKYRLYRRLYMVLLITKELEEKRQRGVYWMVDEMTRKLLKLPDQIATIVGRTFAFRGDGFIVSDDEALNKIRDLIESIDPEILERNKNKRLQ